MAAIQAQARRLWLPAVLLCVGLITTVAAAADRPLRVCLPPAPHTQELKKLTAAERLQMCVSLFFRDRLAALPNVEVMNEEWAGAVLFFGGPATRGTAAVSSLAEFRTSAPVDVVLLYAEKEAPFGCTILSDKGTDVVPPPARRETTAWLRAVADRLGPALGLDARATTALGDCGTASPAMVEACLLSQRIATPWVINSGEQQLVCLRPFIQEVGKQPMLAGAVLRAGTVLSTDTRKPENVLTGVETLRLAVVAALGTPEEDEALAFMRQTVHGRDTLEKELAGLVKALAADATEGLMDGDAGGRADEPKLAGAGGLARDLGAIRCLAAMKSAALKNLLPRLVAHEEAAVRAAAGYALGALDTAPVDLAEKLTADPDPVVAATGQYALWRRGKASPAAAEAARRLVNTAPVSPPALEFLAGVGTGADEPALRRLLKGTMAERRLAVTGLARLAKLTVDDFRACLQSADDALLALGLKAMDAKTAAACRDALAALANQPHGSAAESARRALRPLRPADDLKAQLAFDLEVEHLYLRLRTIERLAHMKEGWSLALLEEATKNTDPQVRAATLLALNSTWPDAATKALPRLLRDPTIWVRVHACSLAAAAKAPALKEAVTAALAAETDSTCRIHLETALGKPPPKPVNGFAADQTRFGLCGYSTLAATSPFGWYYNLTVEVNEVGRQAHDSGKTFIGRANTVCGNPVQAIFHPLWRDRWWTNLRQELKDLQWLDGIVLGEESMYARPWQLWDTGWRCFCVEAGIDAEKIAGDRAKLNAAETRAYLDWEEERAVDGFNRMYDFIKLDQGAPRPGFLVGTYMPDQNGPNIAEHRWKFDVGGAYWYQCDNRIRYNMVRHQRTVWPQRPVMYLVSGNAGLPVLADVNYKLKVPDSLVLNRAANAYTDSVCVWAAGGEPGYFIAYLFMAKDVKPGPMASGKWVWIEDLAPKSPILDDAVAYVWNGVDTQYRNDAELQKVKAADGAPEEVAKQAATKDDGLEEPDLANDEFSKRAAADRERFRLGFYFEQKALYDIARAFTGMPKPQQDYAALMVGDRTALPQFTALDGYDTIELLNQLPLCSLAKYRLIGIDLPPSAPVRDATIVAVRTWLKEQPGLLYVRGFLSTDNANEASTAADHDGRLQEDWPWEADIAFAKDHYTLQGGTAKALAGDAATCTQALWRRDGFKGAVLFDCGKTAPAEFQARLNGIHKEHGAGLAADGVPGMIRASCGKLAACASNGHAADETKLAGVDLFTGEPDPVVAKTRCAAVTAGSFRSTYAAADNGVTVLGDAPVKEVKAIPGGLEVTCAGLIRASAVQGEVTVKPEPPRIEGKPEAIMKWVLFGTENGIARWPTGAGQAVFVRCPGTVTITAAP